MPVTQYIGSRYVPLFADPAEWSSTKTYEPLTIVLHQGNSYTSKQFVPVDIDISNTDYWLATGNFNAQVETYRQEVMSYADDIRAKAFAFATSAAMQQEQDLEIGSICHTNGFHSVNDNGGAWYVITASGTPNGMDVLACYNGLIANLIIESTVTPEMFGAYGDGMHDDGTAISRGLTFDVPLSFSAKVYGISAPIRIEKSLNVNPSAQIKALDDIECILDVHDTTGDALRITGGVYNCNASANYGIKLSGSYGSYVDGVKVMDAIVASVYYTEGCHHCWITKSKLFNKKTMATGIIDVCRDLKIVDCEIYYTNCAVDLRWNIVVITNCHFWSGGASNPSLTSVGILADDTTITPDIICTGVYFDSFKYGIKATNAERWKRIQAINCLFYWASSTTPNDCVGIYLDDAWQWAIWTNGSVFNAVNEISITQVLAGNYKILGNAGLTNLAGEFTPTNNCTIYNITGIVRDKVLYLNFILKTADTVTPDPSTNWYPVLQTPEYSMALPRERVNFVVSDDYGTHTFVLGRAEVQNRKGVVSLRTLTAGGHYIYGGAVIPLRG